MRIALLCKDGNVTRQYTVMCLRTGDSYEVVANFGRQYDVSRAITRAAGLSLRDAERVCRDIVAEKKRAGYIEEALHFRIPSCIQVIDNITLSRLLESPDRWVIQELVPGERLAIQVENGQIKGYDLNNQPRSVPTRIAQDFLRIPSGARPIIDGVLDGDVYRPFDLLSDGHTDRFRSSHADRLNCLANLLPDTSCIRKIETFGNNLQMSIEQLEAASAKGVVFRHRFASNAEPYQQGEPTVMQYVFGQRVDEPATNRDIFRFPRTVPPMVFTAW